MSIKKEADGANMNLTGNQRRGPRGLYGEDRTAEWLDQLRAMWMDGSLITPIATKLNCSRNTVVRWAKRLELPERSEVSQYEVKADEWVDRVRAMWMDGTPVSKIATKMECHKGVILRAVKRYDLPARPSPILRNVTPKPRDTDRHRPGYVAPGRTPPAAPRSVIQKAPWTPPRATVPAPTLTGPSNEPPVRVGVPKLECQSVIAEEPDRQVCGFSCYTPFKHDKPSEFCNFHFHFGGQR